MTGRHKPERMCVACRQMLEQDTLIRIVNDSETAVFDTEKKKFGIGAYICRSAECVKKAQKKKMVERHLKCPVEEGLYERCMSLAEMKKG